MKASSFIGQYLKSDTLKVTGPVTCTVTGVEAVSFEDKDTHIIERKLAVTLADGQKVLLNKSNTAALIELFESDDTDTWLGKVFELYHDATVSFGGKRVGGLRVRAASEAGNPF